MPTLLLGPKLVQPELDDRAGHVDLNFHGELKDWEEGSPTPLAAPRHGRATGPSRMLPHWHSVSRRGFGTLHVLPRLMCNSSGATRAVGRERLSDRDAGAEAKHGQTDEWGGFVHGSLVAQFEKFSRH